MAVFPQSIQALISSLTKLPSVGEKSAIRLAYYMLTRGTQNAKELSDAIDSALAKVIECSNCFFLSEADLCPVCKDPSRDPSIICVVEKSLDVIALERSGEFKGQYFVLHTLWAPLRGHKPDDQKLERLKIRAISDQVKEVILATGSTVEGDATALYISKLLENCNVKTSRLAQGMPKGGELEYLDDLTLSRALSGRSSI